VAGAAASLLLIHYALCTRNDFEDRLRHLAVELIELVVPERSTAVKQTGVVRFPADQCILAVVVPKDIRVVDDHKAPISSGWSAWTIWRTLKSPTLDPGCAPDSHNQG
jgi:hypothetical protein